jgi:hypothetical protein
LDDAVEDEMDGAKIKKSNIILWHTTSRGPNSVPTEAQSGTRVDQREQDPALAPQHELQEVVMISQARVVVVGGGIDGR